MEPFYGTDGAAGMDVCAAEDVLVKVLEPTLIPLGFSLELPVGFVGILALRSSAPKKFGLMSPHGVGVIDSDYRGEWFLQVCALKNEILIKQGERIGQIIVQPARVVDGVGLVGVEIVDELPETSRGVGGFGSTG